MKSFIRLLLLLLPLVAAAQSSLPPCSATGDRPNCYGSATYANGDKYFGEFKNGKRDGQGAYTLTNGNKYVGEFKDDKRNGRGIAHRADGTIERAEQWADGKLVQSFALDRSRFQLMQTPSVSMKLLIRRLMRVSSRPRATPWIEPRS